MNAYLPSMLSPGVLTRLCDGASTWLRTPGVQVLVSY